MITRSVFFLQQCLFLSSYVCLCLQLVTPIARLAIFSRFVSRTLAGLNAVAAILLPDDPDRNTRSFGGKFWLELLCKSFIPLCYLLITRDISIVFYLNLENECIFIYFFSFCLNYWITRIWKLLSKIATGFIFPLLVQFVEVNNINLTLLWNSSPHVTLPLKILIWTLLCG